MDGMTINHMMSIDHGSYHLWPGHLRGSFFERQSARKAAQAEAQAQAEVRRVGDGELGMAAGDCCCCYPLVNKHKPWK